MPSTPPFPLLVCREPLFYVKSFPPKEFCALPGFLERNQYPRVSLSARSKPFLAPTPPLYPFQLPASGEYTLTTTPYSTQNIQSGPFFETAPVRFNAGLYLA
ncbi:hypothetical protein CEXT_463101 [Caerostris extrusa]|uniref:Uncharacterized protein n=1 Tax=Caerostris extrusa TaxID=172846 RepID=A0AAV4T7P3_CAEEX|nr:hypothetical protein CEXT_463101 [Caerostris extrusa]